MRRLFFLLILAAVTTPSLAGAQEYFQQTVAYKINVRLDPKEHMLTGTEEIVYTNNSPDTLKEFYLHLYPNAFKSKDTALMTDVRKRFNRTISDLPKKYRSYLNIYDVLIDTTQVSPIIDDTIAKFFLPRPLAPGATMKISLRFEEKVRRHAGRAGYRKEHYDIAQWYPKVVVYDEKRFHPDKFRLGEFYGEFADYDVSIDIPIKYVIAATGVLEEGDAGWTYNPVKGDRRKGERGQDKKFKTVRFRAENVHDFAWSANPRFSVQTQTLNDVEIMSFFDRGNKSWRDSTLAHGVRAVEWLSERVGLYPYPQLSLVQGLLRGGMEYPMLVMDGHVSESLVVHEVGHNWFYGALANNERNSAWLDEGLTTFQTDWYLTERYGKWGNKKKWNLYEKITPQYTLVEKQRRRVLPLMRRGYSERLSKPAENYKHDYAAMVYGKGSLMFNALRYVVGEEDFEEILKTYYERWKFKHVNEERFQAVCEEVSGMDLNLFFEQWIHTIKVCDYNLSKMKTTVNESGDGYVTEITIFRLGEVVLPLNLKITFRDGTTQTTRIEGRLRTIKKTYSFPSKPKKAALNPENEILDINMADNFLPRRYSLQIDWPNNRYYPEDSYQIRHHPYVWYNDVDGPRVGLHFKGSNAEWSRRFKLGLYYGVDSGRLDVAAKWIRPSSIFGTHTFGILSGYKLEGRQDINVELAYRRRKELSRPPTHNFAIGMNYHELRRSQYISNPEQYQENSDVAPYINYQVDPQFDLFSTDLDFGLRFGREWFGGRSKYTRFNSSVGLKSRPELSRFDTRFRMFFGVVDAESPYQQKFYLAGGGPLAEEKVFFLRSPGAIPKDLNYHEPGHGNLRGYFTGNFGVNRLFSLNLEMGGKVPLISSSKKKFLGEIKVYAFGDAGWVMDSTNPIGTSERIGDLVNDGIFDDTLADAGIGFTLARDLPFWKMLLRLDIPFWVGQPKINGETQQTQHRYVFSLKTSF